MSDTVPEPTPFEHLEAKVADAQPENAAVVDPVGDGSVEREPSSTGAPTAADPLPAPFVGRTELTVIDYMKSWVRREMLLAAQGVGDIARYSENP